jgi:hypothetical protein
MIIFLPVKMLDVVYSYVNDRDPYWQAQRTAARFDPRIHNFNSNSHHRYRDREELRYSLRSLARYAPWVRHVYVVVSTESQVPAWLNRQKVRIITHAQLGITTPTFNSHAIEANLHRIPGISEPFLYLNDDFFLNRPLEPSDFVTSDGKYCLFLLKKHSPRGKPTVREIGHYSAWKNVNQWLDRHFTPHHRRHTAHAPAVLSPRIMRELWQRMPEELTLTTNSTFRSIHDYAITCALHPHYCLEQGLAVVSPLTSYDMQRSGNLERARSESASHAFYYINDTRNDDAYLQVLQQELNPTPSPYEHTTSFRKSRH